MKKVININFQGRVVPIEESSYDLLQDYIASLRTYFQDEEGRDEIINDIESRISELFQERLKSGATCITDEDVEKIISNMGRPSDFEEDAEENTSEGPKEKTEESQSGRAWNYKSKRLYRDENNKILGGVCSGIASYIGIDPWIVRILFIISGIGFLAYIILWIFVPGSNSVDPGVRKRLYRNPDGKIIGGVCSGLGSYFDINAWIPRIIFLLPFISFAFRWNDWGVFSFPEFLSITFSPGTFLVYVILWLVIPEASTTTEKLEMKGEKIDLNSIKKSVLEEMKGVGERVGKMGAQAGNYAYERGPEIGKDIHHAAVRSGGALGNIITTLFKIFLYLVLGCIAFALIIALFSIAIVAIGIFPLKDFILTDGWQNVMAWGTLIFFIGVPVVGLITFIIRRIARIKGNSRFMRYSFAGLWILGIICFIMLVTSVAKDFRTVSSFNQRQVALSVPQVETLVVQPTEDINRRRLGWFRFEPYSALSFDQDTAYIGNVNIIIKKSSTDSFRVSYTKVSNGNTRRSGDTLAALIDFDAYQSDSSLYLDNAIAINTTDKFRNQFVEVVVEVPVGHKIRIDESFGYRNRGRIEFFYNNDDWYYYNQRDDYDFEYGETYIMKEDGLYTLDGYKSSDEWRRDDERDNEKDWNEEDSNYRYEDRNRNSDSVDEQIRNQLDSMKRIQEEKLKQMRDSLLEVKDIPQSTAAHCTPQYSPYTKRRTGILPIPVLNFI